MVTTTQEHINGAAARFQADNAGDDTVAAAGGRVLYGLEIIGPSWIREGHSEIYKTKEAAERAKERVLWSHPEYRLKVVVVELGA